MPQKRIANNDFNHSVGTQTTTAQGFILADIVLARTGVLEYTGAQIGRPDKADKVFKVYRPESSLSNKETIKSFELAPFTVNHPSGDNAPDGMLNPQNVKEFSEGTLTENVTFSDGTLKSQVLITTDGAQEALDYMQESSIGFYSSYDFTEGTTPCGEHYDAIQLNIEGNHVALVESGRSGQRCKVLDSKLNPNGGGQMPDPTKKENLVTLKVAGKDCSMTEVSSVYVTQTLDAQEATINEQKTKLDAVETAQATSDAKIDSLEKELAAAKKLTSPEALQASIDARVELVEKAKTLDADIDTKGKDDLTIMREAIVANNDSVSLEGKSDAYVTSYFDIIVEKAEASLDEELGGSVKNLDKKPVLSIQAARANVAKIHAKGFVGNNIGDQ